MAGLHPDMREALMIADRLYKTMGKELVVTSALDGEHSAGSWHYYGRALDFRVRYFTHQEKEFVRDALKRDLLGFRVFLEETHIHVDKGI